MFFGWVGLGCVDCSGVLILAGLWCVWDLLGELSLCGLCNTGFPACGLGFTSVFCFGWGGFVPAVGFSGFLVFALLRGLFYGRLVGFLVVSGFLNWRWVLWVLGFP